MQAIHFVSSALFSIIHVSHSHAPSGFLNLSPNPMKPVDAGAVDVGADLTVEKAEERVNEGLSPVPSLAVSQATHFTAYLLLFTRHVSHSQVSAGLENIVPKPFVVVVLVVMLLLPLSDLTAVSSKGLLSKEFDEEE